MNDVEVATPVDDDAITKAGVAGERLCEPIENEAHGVLVAIPTFPSPLLLLLKMLFPAIVHGVFIVRAVPPTKAPGVPLKVMPVPAETDEVATVFSFAGVPLVVLQ